MLFSTVFVLFDAVFPLKMMGGLTQEMLGAIQVSFDTKLIILNTKFIKFNKQFIDFNGNGHLSQFSMEES